MFFAHVLSAGGRIDFRLASLDHALEIVHVKILVVKSSMQDPGSDFQP